MVLGLKGIAQNKPDGTFYTEIEGGEEKLQEFINWCTQGPSFSKVKSFNIEEGEVKNFNGFEIL